MNLHSDEGAEELLVLLLRTKMPNTLDRHSISDLTHSNVFYVANLSSSLAFSLATPLSQIFSYIIANWHCLKLFNRTQAREYSI